MAVIPIEPGDLKEGTCPECGSRTGTVTGFAYQDGDANSVYYLGWCEGRHDDRTAFLTISSGSWGEETSGRDRLMVGIEVRAAGMRLADSPAFENPDFLGRFVPREEAMRLGELDGLWHLADHIVIDDPAASAVLAWIRDERESAFP